MDIYFTALGSAKPANPVGAWVSTLAPGRQDGVSYHLNLVGKCGILPSGEDAVGPLGALLIMRPYLANHGGIVLPWNLFRKAGELYDYGRRVGLIPGGSVKRTTWVGNYWDYEALARKAENENFLVDPYQGGVLVLQSLGAQAAQDELSAIVADRYSDKPRFKQLVAEVGEGIGIAVNNYPRLVVDARDPKAVERAVRDLVSRGYDKLFAQGAVGAGGLYNLIVDIGSRSVVGAAGTHTFDGLSDLSRLFPVDVEGDGRYELAPLLPLERHRSFSFGLTLMDQGVMVAGPRYQKLGDRLEYRGLYASLTNLPPDVEDKAEDSSFAAVLKDAKSLAEGVARRLHAEGYRGPLSMDCFVYPDRSPSGYALCVAEANMRRDGTSFLTSLLAGVGDFTKGAIQGLDNVEVPESNMAALVERIKRHNVPLFSRSSQQGVILLTPPIPAGENGQHLVCAGFVETDPARLRGLVSAFERAMMP